MPLAIDVRATVELLRHSCGRARREYREGQAMNVCMQWTSKLWAGQLNRRYTRRGLLHVTLCGHEGLRTYWRRRAELSLQRAGRTNWMRAFLLGEGIEYLVHKYTRRLNVFFFTFCLSIEWCAKPSIERVDANDIARRNVNLF